MIQPEAVELYIHAVLFIYAVQGGSGDETLVYGYSNERH